MKTSAYLKLMRRGGKRLKYGNKKIEVDGKKFDSVAEANRWSHLRLRERIGEITDLECQPKFDIIANGKKVAYYKADFRYRVVATSEIVIEDVKSPITAKEPLYRLKKKLVEALYDIVITEIAGR